MTSLDLQNSPMKQSDCYCPILHMDKLRFRKVKLLDQDHSQGLCMPGKQQALVKQQLVLWLYHCLIVLTLSFFNRLCFRAVWAHSEIKGKAQKFPVYPLPPHRPSLRVFPGSFPGSSVGKESACSAGDPCSIPGQGRSPGEGNGNLPQYSCLENRGAWRATSLWGSESRTATKPPPPPFSTSSTRWYICHN